MECENGFDDDGLSGRDGYRSVQRVVIRWSELWSALLFAAYGELGYYHKLPVRKYRNDRVLIEIVPGADRSEQSLRLGPGGFDLVRQARKGVAAKGCELKLVFYLALW